MILKLVMNQQLNHYQVTQTHSDGLDVLCGILDEYGEAKDTSIIEVLESSQAQQVEGLILMISTATKNLNGPMFTIDYAFVEKLLNDEVKADAYLALCWEMDSHQKLMMKRTG